LAFAGSNQDLYPTLQHTAVRIGNSDSFLAPNGQRVYLNDGTFPNAIPAAWPKLSDSSARACVSIRPRLDQLVNGELDGALKTFLTSAPGGATSLLGLWHESSTHGPAKAYAAYYASLNKKFPHLGGAAGLLRKAQAHVQAKAKHWNANVKVGAIEVVESSSGLAARLDPWMAKDLDFYAGDIYDFKDGTAVPSDLLGAFRKVCDNRA
jgi:hypothetical protein